MSTIARTAVTHSSNGEPGSRVHSARRGTRLTPAPQPREGPASTDRPLLRNGQCSDLGDDFSGDGQRRTAVHDTTVRKCVLGCRGHCGQATGSFSHDSAWLASCIRAACRRCPAPDPARRDRLVRPEKSRTTNIKFRSGPDDQTPFTDIQCHCARVREISNYRIQDHSRRGFTTARRRWVRARSAVRSCVTSCRRPRHGRSPAHRRATGRGGSSRP